MNYSAYEDDDEFPAARRSRRDQSCDIASGVLGVLGAVAAGAWMVGSTAIEQMAANPELAQALGAVAGAPWVGPALGIASILVQGLKGKRSNG